MSAGKDFKADLQWKECRSQLFWSVKGVATEPVEGFASIGLHLALKFSESSELFSD